ncbi:glycoside hydrolase family 16 [Pyrenophora seminiperda CCB06]|uniref:Glycoside hydrolase family 16 n=1 Tax=Pyrenophora seminiperda CCB06 TaxID=1302712 RepID=A0A3M7MII8_9PLEO|nr:glycoside hydrolase family 16 [Pyrenophora seminiperda CCB06]
MNCIKHRALLLKSARVFLFNPSSFDCYPRLTCEQGIMASTIKSTLKPSRLAMFSSAATTPMTNVALDQNHLVGLRGLLVFQSFLFIFFQAFLPGAVIDSRNLHGPAYQTGLRKSISVILANGPLIYGWIIFLSARTICLPYLSNKSRQVCASSVFRRSIRLWIPTFVAYSLAAAAFSTTSTDYISEFLISTNNVSTIAPLRMRNFLIYFNSLFELFWVNKDYASQAANLAFPSGTLWIISILFQQSYTVYMTMVIVPSTRVSWRVKAMVTFIAAAWWVQSWAWYSVTGLLIADAVLNMDFALRSRRGLQMGTFTLPIWPLYATMVVTGVLLQFLFVSAKPSMRDDELYGHTALYEDGFLNKNMDASQPMARVDNYLIILGASLLIETFEWPRGLLRRRFFVAMGRRSFSWFLMQSLVVYTVGIILYMQMANTGSNTAMSAFVAFVVCLPLTALLSEVFYRVVDIPSIVVARSFWAFMTT